MGDLAERDLSSALAHVLERSAAVCVDTLARYDATDSELMAALMRATAALQAALRLHTRDAEVRDVSLRIAADLGRETVTRLRAAGFDDGLLRCAEACDRAVYMCEDVLADADQESFAA